MKKQLGVILIAVLFMACDQISMSDKASVEVAPTQIQSAELANYLKVNVVPGDPEKYTVQFSWPTFQDNKILRIRLNSVLTEVKPEQTFFTHQVAHNQVLTYSFDVLDSSRVLERTTMKTVNIPYDFVVRQGQDTATGPALDANRIFLSESIPFTTLGADVEITANEIHSNKGTIQSFPSDYASPPLGAVGKSAGKISITAKLLFGKMKITMRGQIGGQGRQGDPVAGRGPTGSAPGAGQITCDDSQTACWCGSMGSDGGTGLMGAQGNVGKTGMTGGDTGSIRVIISQYKSHEGSEVTTPGDEEAPIIDVQQVPGDGGKGGEGGPGQAGGIGGQQQHQTCEGNAGPDGPIGPQGPIGPKGPEGKIGSKCIYIGSENQNECAQ